MPSKREQTTNNIEQDFLLRQFKEKKFAHGLKSNTLSALGITSIIAWQVQVMKFSSSWAMIMLVWAGFCTNPALAFQEPGHTRLAGFDRRPATKQRHAPLPEQAAGRASLARRISGLTVDFDPVTGAPRSVRATGFLTGPQGHGRGVRRQTIQALDPQRQHRPLRAFLTDHEKLFGHGPEALDRARWQRSFKSKRHGLETAIWQQQAFGIPVFEAVLIAHTTREEELVSVSSGFLPDPDRAVRNGHPRGRRPGQTPAIPARRALQTAAANLGIVWTESEIVTATDPGDDPEKKQVFTPPDGSGAASAQLIWLPLDRDTLRLCWEVILTSKERGESFRILVDAESAEPLIRQSLTHYLTEATYRVFTSDSPSPLSPGHLFATNTQPPLMMRSLVMTGAGNTNASPWGWINDGDNTTSGNNVRAHTDINGDNMADLPRPQGTPFRVFDFPLDLEQDPELSKEASVVQVFYWNNWIHDQLYELGFDEAAGNFQIDNFGRGGVGGDPVEADVLDGAGVNNANFTTLPDGTPGRMQMFLFVGPTPPRDGAFDAEVVLHEYVHGLSNRRVGGGVGLSARQSSGLGEGWSDFYALSLLSEQEDDIHGNYAFGAYASYLLNGLMENYYFGIRRYPYSTDRNKNPLTFKDIDPTQADPHFGVPRSPGAPGPADQVHRQGEVWCSALWDARALLIEKYGFETGNRLMLQIVTDGMVLTPPNPTFIQARDAILQADEINQGGANSDELWMAFAGRGLGVSAEAPPSTTTVGVKEAFDVPDDLTISPASGFTATGPLGGPFTPGQAVYSLSNGGNNSLTWSTSHDAYWLTIQPSSGSLAPGATEMNVQVSINPGAAFLPSGLYSEKLLVLNETSGRAQELNIVLRSGLADFFTEFFQSGGNDLNNLTLTLTPDGSVSHYSACLEPATIFPTPPESGQRLTMLDDDFRMVTLTNGAEVELYGRRTNAFFIGSNGYVTLANGDSNFEPSLSSHFEYLRIAGLFLDLDPTSGGVICWQQLSDRAVVTFDDIPLFRSGIANNFQIEMFFDGRLRLTWLDVQSAQGLAGLSRGEGVPDSFLQSDLTDYPSCSKYLSLVLPASAAEGIGVGSDAGMIHLSVPPTMDLVVNLVSSHPGELEVPSELLIATGQTNASFDLNFPEDVLVDGSQVAHVIATAEGYGGAYGSVSVEDNETAVLALALPPIAGEGDAAFTGIITVDPPVDTLVRVPLMTSDPTEVALPDHVIFSPGINSTSFVFSIIDDREIDGTSMVQVSAEVSNWTGADFIVTIADNESLEISVTAPSIANERSGTLAGAGSVQLQGTLATNFSLALHSSDSNSLQVAASVIIPVGQTNAPFDLHFIDNSLVDGKRLVELEASRPGWVPGMAALEVFDDETPLPPSLPSPQNQAKDVPVTSRLGWFLEDPGLTNSPPTSFEVFLGVSPELGLAESLGVTTNLQWDLPGGLSPLSTYYWRVTALREVATEGPIWTFTTKGVDRLEWSEIPRRQRVNAPFEVTLAAQDEFGTQVTNFIGTAMLSGLGGTEEGGSRIVLSELDMGTPDSAEFANVSNQEIDIGGWDITFYDSSRWPDPVLRFVIPAGTSVPPSGVFRLVESGSFPGAYPLFFSGTNVSWVHSLAVNQMAVLLRDASGAVADFMCAAGAFPGQIQEPASIPPKEWTGAPLAANDDSNFDYQRVGMVDSNSQDDWVLAQASPGALSPGLVVPFPSTVREIALAPAATGAFAEGGWTGTITVAEPVTDLTLRATTDSGAFGISDPILVLRSNDVTLEMTASPVPVVISSNLVYTLKIYNAGPLTATNVTLTNILSDDVILADVNFSQGFCTSETSFVRCELGNLTVGMEAEVVLRAIVVGTGVLTNDAMISTETPDAFSGNNHRTIQTPSVPVPVLFLADALVIEGNEGTNYLQFEASLSTAVAHEIAADYQTVSQTAAANADYLPSIGTVVFPPGSLRQTIAIPVLGDKTYEANETFGLSLVNVSGVLPGDVQGVGTILNDDAAPGFTIEDTQVVEGDTGVTNALFTVRLTQASGLPARMQYSTVDNSARSVDGDYQSRQGLLEMPAGATNAVVVVPVNGDLIDEPNETFFVVLSSATNAFILDNQGVAVIEDDDPLPILSIEDAVTQEGDDEVTQAIFALTLTPASGKTVLVSYRTTDQTATAGSDFAGTNGTLSFAPGVSTGYLAVNIYGDFQYEPDESFEVTLSNPLNANLSRFSAQGVVVNDDPAPGDPIRYAWSEVEPAQSARRPFAARITGVDVFDEPATNFQGTVRLRAFAGGTTTGTILSAPSLMGTTTKAGSRTVGYAFTPSTNLLVTHFLHLFGQKITLWTDAGEVVVSREIDGASGVWRQTALDEPVQLDSGNRYRIGVFTGDEDDPYFFRTDMGSSFAHGTIDLSLTWAGDAFPFSVDASRWHLVDFLYLAGARGELPVEPVMTTAFTNGIWGGLVQINDAAEDVVLCAEDESGHMGFSTPFQVYPVDDLSLSLRVSHPSVVAGHAVSYSMTVSNSGPALASNVVLEIEMPASVKVIGSDFNQSNLDFSILTLTAELGGLAAGTSVEGTLEIQPQQAGTNLVATGRVRRAGSEWNEENNVARAETAVLHPVTIRATPQPLNVMRGAKARFSVQASAVEPLTYQWFRNGIPIPGASNSILALTAANVADAGQYAVEVSAADYSVTTAPAVLNVNPTPTGSPPGYFEMDLPPGYTSLANPLTISENTMRQVLFSVPNGTTVLRANQNGYVINNYLNGWDDPDMSLMPGEGFYIKNPTATNRTIFFFGQIQEGTLVNQLPEGHSYISSIAPQSGGLVNSLGFPDTNDITAYLFENTSGGYRAHAMIDQDWIFEEPFIAAAKGFRVQTEQAIEWRRQFTTFGSDSGPYRIHAPTILGTEGTVNFLTYNTDPTRGLVTGPDGTTPLSSGHLGQLYGGTRPDDRTFLPVGEPVPFLTETNAGYINAGMVKIPGTVNAQRLFFQLRAWEAAGGSTFEMAQDQNAAAGKSEVMTLTVGAPLSGIHPGQLPPDANAFANFSIRETPPNTPPTLEFIADRFLHAGMTLRITNSASDAESPLANLTFELPVGPANASIETATGVFSWTPGDQDAPSTNLVVVRVTDDGLPPLSAERSFQIAVLHRPAFAEVAVMTDGTVSMSWIVIPGADYRVQYKDELGPGNWIDLPGEIIVEGSLATFVDATGPAMQRFYRIIVLP